MRARKPWAFLRFRVCGWYVRFITGLQIDSKQKRVASSSDNPFLPFPDTTLHKNMKNAVDKQELFPGRKYRLTNLIFVLYNLACEKVKKSCE
jgi:hypothetical protein